eukprot:CAMPEP_0172181970 /NCGR_PEP_ID=MMETSP1050-20130122/18130_1 /TAXON_ID=233186 /ORGANISM="Cryptomonas curvata, Strain CCAP979/52" /LENGTH=264 /DNA_ID=CAMNT_0012855345 /DNA_START=69 /DNA_END=860 /DNA_ORIENTATION=+
MAHFPLSPPFDVSVHLNSPPPEKPNAVLELRSALLTNAVYTALMDTYPEVSAWCTDQQLTRFLIARNFNVAHALKLLLSALEWRALRRPELVERMPGFEEVFGKQGATGKVYCPGTDRWGRPVLVLDNTVENSSDADGRLLFLAWNLEFACRQMGEGVDKYVVFLHLGRFSIFNAPPMRDTRETIRMVCQCYPERLGHCVIYRPPGVFSAFWSAVKGLVDARTASKLVFVTGDVADGSANDARMTALIGPDWKAITGAEQPVHR